MPGFDEPIATGVCQFTPLCRIVRRIREFLPQKLDGAIPIAELRLADKPRVPIPRAVAAPAQPAEIGRIRQEQEQRLVYRASQMRHRGIDRDHRIECGDCRGRIGKILELGADSRDAVASFQQRLILLAHFMLRSWRR